MPKLILKKKAEVLQELHMKTAKATYSIGAEEDNDLVIDDKRVSMKHALIERHGTRYYVRDMKSAFGTFVNDEKVEDQVELKNGDRLTIGDHSVIFENPLEYLDKSFFGDDEPELKTEPIVERAASNGENPVSEPESVVVQMVEEDPAITPAKEEAVKAAPDENMAPYYLLAIHGPYRGKKYQLRYGETRIGRDSKLNDIVIRENKRGEVDPSISRRHATISYHQNAFHVSDKRSKTRTYVNQTPVPEDGEISLHPGDEIEIVSDQQSTIFRFVAESDWNFSPPKKAGVPWVRMRPRLMAAGAAVILLAGVVLLFNGFFQRRMLAQQPAPIKLSLVKWAAEKNETARKASPLDLDTIAEIRPGPAVADFTGDGIVDVASFDQSLRPMLIDGKTKRVAWKLNTPTANPQMSFTAADINGNGLTDLLFTSSNGRVIAIDGAFGAEIWASPYFTEPFSGPPVCADFDGDGWIDTAIGEAGGVVHIGYNRVVQMEWKRVEIGFPTLAPLASSDLDGDGDFELFAGSERGLLFIVDGARGEVAGTVDINDELNKARGTLYEENQIRFPTGLMDITGDKIPDLVCTSIQGNILAIDGASRQRLWHDRLSGDIALTPSFVYPFAFADIDANGILDVVVANELGEIRAYLGAGKAPKLWQYTPETPATVIQNLAVGDLTKDGADDITYLDENGLVRLLDGRNGKVLWTSGQPLSERTSMPLIAEAQSDGLMDILLVSEQGRTYQFKSNARFPSGAVVWDQLYGHPTHSLASAFALPGTGAATAKIALGILAVLLSLAYMFMRQRNRRIVPQA